MTGGQRIDLLGVRKEDLPAVWAQLNAAGMVSGQAYAKGLRTVKTCVGSEWCRFGTQDSTGLGVKLEQLPVRLVDARQGQARGLRLSAQLRRGDGEGHRHRLRRIRLRHSYRGRGRTACARDRSARHVATEEEAIEYVRCGACSSIASRPTYLDRIYKWAEMTGLEQDPRRASWTTTRAARALVERFLKSQRAARKDPWAERAAGRELHEFMPLAVLVPVAPHRPAVASRTSNEDDP